MLYFFAAAFIAIFKRVFACCFKKGGEEEEEEPEVTYTEALPAREAQAGKPNAGNQEQSNALSGVPVSGSCTFQSRPAPRCQHAMPVMKTDQFS